MLMNDVKVIHREKKIICVHEGKVKKKKKKIYTMKNKEVELK